jgi:FMN-dependent oxidoreductase (nitrilotriacetate monooxygenase family)
MTPMSPKRFHLAWFTNFGVDEWLDPMSSAGGNPWSGKFYVDFAQSLERACFDCIMFADTLMVSDSYGNDLSHTLKNAVNAPRHDPMPLTAVIGAQTRQVGIVATMSTLGYPPFLLARLACTTDHITGGRFGWNIVTSGENSAAQNFGLNELPEHDLRYEMADEYMEVVNRLFASWDKDAVIMDRTSAMYADGGKVRPINFVGKYYRCRGPLNTAPSPQGRPTYFQAGGSPRGREFAARHADAVIATANGVKAMKAFREDIRERVARFGRDPDNVKVLYQLSPVLGETEAGAQAANERGLTSKRHIEQRLALVSALTDIDFSKFDLDKPLPPLTTNGESTVLAKFTQQGSNKPLRQLVREEGKGGVDLVGTPDQVAKRMGEVMAEVGGDGFLIKHPFHQISRRYINEVTEGLVPALQRRNLVRTEYTKPTLCETLREF